MVAVAGFQPSYMIEVGESWLQHYICLLRQLCV